MRRCFAMKCNKTLLLLFTIIVIFSGEISANQLDVAKKYGKRFGNKNKTNSTTESKEVTKSVLTKPSESLIITEPATKLAKQVRNEQIPEMQSMNTYSFTKLENMSTTTQSPTQLIGDQHPNNNNNQNSQSNADVIDTSIHTGVDEHEVDVDLSQLQVSLPNVKFDCKGRTEGYYGDPDYKCEVFHYCNGDANRDTFLCPSNSKFNQKDMTCDTESIDDLCVSEPVWGHNHLYPSTVQPKYSPPITVTKDETPIISSNHTISVNENKNNYYYGHSDPMADIVGNEDLRKNNKNNDNKDKSKNKNNKTYAFNYFGGNFGDRYRNPTTNANDGHLSEIDRKNNSNNNESNNNKFGSITNENNYNYNNDNEKYSPVVSYSEPNFRKKQTVTQQHQFYKESSPQNNFEKQIEKQIQSENNNQFLEQNKNQNKMNEQIFIEQIEHYPYLNDKPYISSAQSEPIAQMPQRTSTTKKPSSAPSTVRTRRPLKPNNLESYLSDVGDDRKQSNVAQQESQAPIFDFSSFFETQPPSAPQSPQHHNEPPVIVKNWIIPQNDYIPQYLQTSQTSTTERPERWPLVNPNEAFNQIPPKTVEYDHPVRTQSHISNQNLDTKPKWNSAKEQVAEQLPQENGKPQQNSAVMQTWNSMEKHQYKPDIREHHNANKNSEPVFQQSLTPEAAKQNMWSQEIKDDLSLPFREPVTNYQKTPLKPKWTQEIIEMIELPHNVQNNEKNSHIKNVNLTPESNMHNTQYSVESAINYNRIPDQQNHNTPQSNRDMQFKQHSQHQQQHKKDNRQHQRQTGFQESQQQYQGSGVSNNNGNYKEQNGVNQHNYVFHERFRPIKLSEIIPNKDEDLNSGQFPLNLKFSPKQQQFFDEQLKQVIASKLRPNVDPKYLSLENPSKLPADKKLTGYVAEVLPSEDGAVMSKKPHQQKSVKQRNKDKHGNTNKTNKQKKTISTANFLDELLSTENGWTFKHFDSNLDSAFSQAFPIIPISSSKSKKKNYPSINLFGQNFHQVSHPVGAIPYQSAVIPQLSVQPQPQQTIHLQMPSHQVHQQLQPVHHNLQAQHSFPMQYYLPYYPMSQQLRTRPFQQQKLRIWK